MHVCKHEYDNCWVTCAGCRQAGRRQVYEDDARSADDEAEAGSNYSEEGSDAEGGARQSPQNSLLLE